MASMEFHLLPIFVLFSIMLVAVAVQRNDVLVPDKIAFVTTMAERSDVSVPAEIYWHSKLPNTPIPQDLFDLIHHVGDKYMFWNMKFPMEYGKEKYGKRYEKKFEQATVEDTTDSRPWYGRRYEQAFEEDTTDSRPWYGKRYEQTFAEDTTDSRPWYGRRYEQAFEEDTTDSRPWYGIHYKQAFKEDTTDSRPWYGRRYEQAFEEDTTDSRPWYGIHYKQAFKEDTTDSRPWYGRRYEQAFEEDTTDSRPWYGKRYEQAFEEDTTDSRPWYGKRYEQTFAEDTTDSRPWYGKRYEQAFEEDTTDRPLKYGKRYEQPFAEDTIERRPKYGTRYELKFNKHALSNSSVFFLPNDLHAGKKMRVHITKSTNKARILPRQVADSLPFSTNKLAEIMKRFSVNPESRQGKMLKQIVENCESPGIKGEDKFCPTSLESLVDFSVKHVGNKAQVLMNEIDKPKREQEYTIKEVKFIGENHVVCHKQKYPYAVYYCHALNGTKVYTAQVVGADGTKAKAVAVCHTNTSAWNPGHLAFLVLNMKPGEGTVCHFIKSDTFVMVSN